MEKVTPEIRQEVIQATGLCLNLNCTAHDAIVIRIWEYAHREDSGEETITLVREETIKKYRENIKEILGKK